MDTQTELTKAYVTKAKEVHGDRYDYNKTVVVKNKRYITITCRVHGDFIQDRYSHLHGFNCSKCTNDSKRLTQKEFLTKAKEVHGDKYDYTESKFFSVKDKVKIKCKIHGEFLQAPKSHFEGQGCPKCDPTINHTTEDFILKAKEVHGDKYDYSKVNYINAFTKITITCPIHGSFSQTPNAHLSGQGCRLCGNVNKSLTKEEFISRSLVVHNNKYSYDKVEYVNNYSKVIITCPVHGDFEQYPSSHLSGHGCYICSKEKNRIKKDDFIKKASEIHNGKYIYDKTNFKVTRDYVNIKCPVHGYFTQKVNNHLLGTGCPKCRNDGNKKTTEEFIKNAIKVHGDKYDYSDVIYKSVFKAVKIICKKHGGFKQRPRNHLKGAGCPVCKASKGELAIRGILVKKNITQIPQYRIPQLENILYYDFYLPEYNLLIEFHGKQHYEYIPHFHRNGEDDLLAQKNRDDLVRHFAKEFKYNYLEFNYKQLKELGTEKFQELVLKSLLSFKKLEVNQIVT